MYACIYIYDICILYIYIYRWNIFVVLHTITSLWIFKINIYRIENQRTSEVYQILLQTRSFQKLTPVDTNVLKMQVEVSDETTYVYHSIALVGYQDIPHLIIRILIKQGKIISKPKQPPAALSLLNWDDPPS